MNVSINKVNEVIRIVLRNFAGKEIDLAVPKDC